MATTEFSSQAMAKSSVVNDAQQGGSIVDRHLLHGAPHLTGGFPLRGLLVRDGSIRFAHDLLHHLLKNMEGAGHFPQSAAEHFHDPLRGLATGVGTGTSTGFITGTGTCLNIS